MPGALLYIAQMTTTPTVDASWTVIYGSGKSRLPVLVPGQTYSFRVAAVGKNGKQSAWSATVQGAEARESRGSGPLALPPPRRGDHGDVRASDAVVQVAVAVAEDHQHVDEGEQVGAHV
jgi:hypothetical protein